MLTKSLVAIKDALVNKKSSITINNSEEVPLLPSTAVFSLSHQNCFSPLPEDLKKLFRVVSYTSPNLSKLLEVGLIKAGMLLTQNIVPKIHSFLMLLKDVFEMFSAGFEEKKISELTHCIHENFKDVLKWKDGAKIAKELSTVTEVVDAPSNPDPSNMEGIECIDTKTDLCKPGNANSSNNTSFVFDDAVKEM